MGVSWRRRKVDMGDLMKQGIDWKKEIKQKKESRKTWESSNRIDVVEPFNTGAHRNHRIKLNFG
jgi:uncharacterized protein YqeY